MTVSTLAVPVSFPVVVAMWLIHRLDARDEVCMFRFVLPSAAYALVSTVRSWVLGPDRSKAFVRRCIMSVGIRVTKPGAFDSLNCSLWHHKMSVDRDRWGPTSFAEATGRRDQLHDQFECPHREADWHVQASKLEAAARDEPSRLLSVLRNSEACLVVFLKWSTKVVTRY